MNCNVLAPPVDQSLTAGTTWALSNRLHRHSEGIDESYRLFAGPELEILAGVQSRLITDAESLSCSRKLEGQISPVKRSTCALPGREPRANYLREFDKGVKVTESGARLNA